MSEQQGFGQPHSAQILPEATQGAGRTAEEVAHLLDVVAAHSVDQTLNGLEEMLARLRAHADEAADAREAIRETPAPVVREALRLRAARLETPQVAAAAHADGTGAGSGSPQMGMPR